MDVLVALSLVAQAQLHVITGAPTPKRADYFGAALWRVEPKGSVTEIAKLCGEDEGLHRLDMLHQQRKALLMTKFPKVQLIVLDFDSTSVIKACPIPKGTYEWASVNPLRFNIYRYGQDIQGVDLTSAIACRDSLRALLPAEFALPTKDGQAGVDQLATNETVPVGIDLGGRIQRLFNGTTVYLGYSIPARFLDKSRQKPPDGALLANTGEVLAYLFGYPNEPSRILVLHKRSATWTELPTTNYAGLRVFGKFVVITDGHFRAASASKSPAAQGEISPGSEEWRKTDGKYGHSVDVLLRNSRMVYGGALHIFDSETGITRTIRTRQADSEVVLIEGRDVYYRVSDRLYRATMSETSVGEGVLIAKADVVRDAHWAFLPK